MLPVGSGSSGERPSASFERSVRWAESDARRTGMPGNGVSGQSGFVCVVHGIPPDGSARMPVLKREKSPLRSREAEHNVLSCGNEPGFFAAGLSVVKKVQGRDGKGEGPFGG